MKRISPLLLFLLLVLAVAPLPARSRKKAPRTIREAAPVLVEAPEGTAPRLPYQVWVTYADNTGEWRQVKWTNSLRETEEEEAALPAGTAYTVQGYVLGDNTTDNGYPLEAKVKVIAGSGSVPGPAPVAKPLPLGSVRLIGDNRLTGNRDLDIKNLLSLDITQQLYNYRDTYGLPTEGYTVSDGWDSPTTKLKGHGSGHYMSALAFAFAGTDDPTTRQELKDRIRRMVDELRACQEMTFVWCDSRPRSGGRVRGAGGHLGGLRPVQERLPEVRLRLHQRHSRPASRSHRKIRPLQQRKGGLGPVLFYPQAAGRPD